MLKKFYDSQDAFAVDFANEFNISEDEAFNYASLMIDCDIFKLNDNTGRITVNRAQVYRMISGFYEIVEFKDINKPIADYDYIKQYGDPSLIFELSYYMQLIYKNNR